MFKALVILLMLCLIVCTFIQKVLQRRAELVWYAAHNEFVDWRLQNPGVYVGISPHGLALIAHCIATYY